MRKVWGSSLWDNHFQRKCKMLLQCSLRSLEANKCDAGNVGKKLSLSTPYTPSQSLGK